MKALPARVKRHQSRRALAVSSGPLAQRTKLGAVPRSDTRRSRTSTVLSRRCGGGSALRG